MPHHKSCKKRMVTSAQKRLVNRENRTETRTRQKRFRDLVQSGEAKDADLHGIYSVIDVQARKGIIPRKRASRLKSRMAALFAKTAE